MTGSIWPAGRSLDTPALAFRLENWLEQGNRNSTVLSSLAHLSPACCSKHLHQRSPPPESVFCLYCMTTRPFVVGSDHKNLPYLRSACCLNSRRSQCAVFLYHLPVPLTNGARFQNIKPKPANHRSRFVGDGRGQMECCASGPRGSAQPSSSRETAT